MPRPSDSDKPLPPSYRMTVCPSRTPFSAPGGKAASSRRRSASVAAPLHRVLSQRPERLEALAIPAGGVDLCEPRCVEFEGGAG
jgi:hypothetical protein